MTKIKEYLTNPATWIAFVVFVFGLGWVYAKLNYRLDAIEQQQTKQERQLQELDVVWIKIKLWEIQTDLQWLKSEWLASKK